MKLREFIDNLQNLLIARGNIEVKAARVTDGEVTSDDVKIYSDNHEVILVAE